MQTEPENIPQSDQLPPSHSERVVSGPIVKTIFSLALPVTLGMLMEVVLLITDFYWVGRLGPTAQDAVTTSMVVIWTLFSAISIISIGTTALVSRYVGAREQDRVNHFIRQALWATLGIGLVVTVGGYYSTPGFLKFMGAGQSTMAAAQPYLRLFFISSLTWFFTEVIFAVFRASGDTRTPMKIGIINVVLNMALDPLFIFGWGPVPAYGVLGASVATAISHAVGTTICFWYLLKGRLGYTVPRIFRTMPRLASILKMARIGVPIATQQLAFVIVYWFLIKYVHEFGEAAGAAMGIGNRMESMSYMICAGFGIAASTMVGQNLGAEKPDRASRCAWGAVGLGIGVTMIFSAMFLGVPGFMASIFTSDPEVHKIAVDYLIILGLSQTAMALEIVLEGAFSGAGDTLPPMIVMIPGAAARIPLAYYLAFELNWGINGIWWTLTITSIVKGIVLAYWFWLGRWKLKKV